MRDTATMTTAQLLAAFRDDLGDEGFDESLVTEALLTALGEMVRIGGLALGPGK